MAFRVLVIDDDPQVLRSVRGWLDLPGYSVLEPQPVINILEQSWDLHPDLILLGEPMSSSAADFCRQLHGRVGMQTTPVLLLSEGPSARLAKELTEGVTDFILKPLRSEDLLARVNLQREFSQNSKTHSEAQSCFSSETGTQIHRQASFAQHNPNPVLELSALAEINYCNGAAVAMARALGRDNLLQILPPDTVEVVRHCLSTGSPRLRVELPIEARVISWSFFPVALSNTVHCYGGDITERKRMEAERDQLIIELQKALANVKSLNGLLPICASCKKIRDDHGYWSQVERYVQDHSQATFTHGMCPDCSKIYFPGLRKEVRPEVAKQSQL